MTDSPSVNRCLKDKSMDNIDHALGRPFDPLAETYRSHFVCVGALADEMAASPYWSEANTLTGGQRAFLVTHAGREALSAHLKALPNPLRKYEIVFDGITSFHVAASAGKAKYQCWLSVSDCIPDLTFFGFCFSAKVRRVA